MPRPTRSLDWSVVAAVTVAVLAWSSAWVSIRAAVTHYTPGELALGRYIIASLVLLPIWAARGRKLPPKSDWPAIFVMGVLGFTIYNLCVNKSEETVTAGAAAFLASTIPLLSTLGAALLFREPIRVTTWIGGVISLTGVGIIALGEKGGLHFSPDAFLVQVAALSAAGYGLIGKNLLKRHASLEVTTWTIWCGTLAMIPFGLDLPAALRTAPLTATANMVALGIFPAALGYALWSYALSRLPISRLTSFIYLIAPLTVLIGWLYLGEIPGMLSLIGGFTTLSGVILANRKPAAKPTDLPVAPVEMEMSRR
jgi:drug/metabolite transporter (DMT)-like permease